MAKLCIECEEHLPEKLDVCPYCGEFLDFHTDGEELEYEMGDE
ncbi:hypothetical protein SAMN05444487_11443 [Marininema mesophilum]|uniref:Uncharacterized protein n=1 Tax=Marininema mesophilum TaxID=1048340 RepID=A0A1H3ATG0_9BACL|nr:hypothetical protein [Marininema mesophilum]SDX32688.1 hypothetical protein SAMN05444487_11443 [Marininema mesophilum]